MCPTTTGFHGRSDCTNGDRQLQLKIRIRVRSNKMRDDAFWNAAKTAAKNGLPDYLLRQRWYPAKDAGRPSVQNADFLPFRSTRLDAAIAVWQVTPPKTTPLLMFVPLAVIAANAPNADRNIASFQIGDGDSKFAVIEAFSEDRFVRAWLEFQLGSSTFSDSGRSLIAGRTQHRIAFDAQTSTLRRPKLEQSNTSIQIGDGAVLKALRKLEAGVHPELEISRFLDQAGFAATPRLMGWIELARQTDGERYALSLLQQFVANQGDGWSWILNQLAHGMASGRQTSPDETADWLRVLAQRTAEMHRTFASDSPNPAFQPELVEQSDLDSWVSGALAMAELALQGIAAYADPDDENQRLAAEFDHRRNDLRAHIQFLSKLRSHFFKTRHHGDFHLGQVLVTGKDAVILDFEGEPLRSLADRRAKNCVLRDVAGVLRSLSYAADSAARNVPSDKSPGQFRKIVEDLDRWRSSASRSFVESYFAAAGNLRSIPAEHSEARLLLKFFLLEKALYEINYELANRPDWVAIPLRGVLSLMRDAGPGPT